jgi:hypothetical protein
MISLKKNQLDVVVKDMDGDKSTALFSEGNMLSSFGSTFNPDSPSRFTAKDMKVQLQNNQISLPDEWLILDEFAVIFYFYFSLPF